MFIEGKGLILIVSLCQKVLNLASFRFFFSYLPAPKAILKFKKQMVPDKKSFSFFSINP